MNLLGFFGNKAIIHTHKYIGTRRPVSEKNVNLKKVIPGKMFNFVELLGIKS